MRSSVLRLLIPRRSEGKASALSPKPPRKKRAIAATEARRDSGGAFDGWPRAVPKEESDPRRRAQRREEGEGEEHLEFQGSGQEEGRHREPGGPVRPQVSRECGETRPKDRQPGKEGIDVDEIDEMESEKGVPPRGAAPE